MARRRPLVGGGSSRSCWGWWLRWAGIGLALVAAFLLGALTRVWVPGVPSSALMHAYGASDPTKTVRAQGLDICTQQQQHQQQPTCSAPRPLFTISHPKSGRTWLRCLVSHAFACLNKYNDTLSLADIEMYSGNVLDFSHGEPHHPFSSTPWDLAYAFAEERPHNREHGVLLVRDPRDVIVSSYYERRYREHVRWIPPWTSLSQYITWHKGSLRTLLMFLNLWSAVVEKPGWTVLRYEDMRRCPHQTLRHIVNERLCLGVSEECIQAAVRWCDFGSLQKRAEEAGTSGGAKIFSPASKGNPNSRKVRKGKVGGYRDDLSEADIEYMEQTIQKHLVSARIFGYGTPPTITTED
ncbi:hypothetical protein PTSG_04887 [Salpingoeca rosetta]|uniref:Sulfotransferase domain-containing protein n=1 Tax=Salpingoeca rosetta (strain ATCC 50818 / BSB-021) TaxID=946362 RepID=F2U8X1_SALR5|nr:uncharacterized protein PTSG_04887 [Salpingoeca rosetta]EGD73174.1 hypothetical protein PTSG_04887 [Salpingoeca rosetta]|eukprot:XP_004994205.1 hypothetical protein PTSG_04887 [Salpingoeca rosetta]